MVFDHDNSPNIVLPIQGLRNIKALTFDPVDEYIYWIEGRRGIKKSKDSGSGVSVTLWLLSMMLAQSIAFQVDFLSGH